MKIKKEKLSLAVAWNKRLKLLTRGDRLQIEGNKLRVEGNRLWSEGDKLWSEGDKLRSAGNRIWIMEVLKVCGKIKVDWKNYSIKKGDYECHLETGEVFKP